MGLISMYKNKEDEKKNKREYQQRPEVKERQRKYHQRPDVKSQKKEHQQRPEVKEAKLKRLAMLKKDPTKVTPNQLKIRGKFKHSGGYILCYCPPHPFSSNRGYMAEHRWVMEQYLGRFLTPEEIVHHIDDIKDNNIIENLHLFPSNSKHRAYHKSKKGD